MRIVLDLNVILDVLLARQDALESTEVLSLARSKMIEAFLPSHGMTTIYYITRKVFPDAVVRGKLSLLLDMASVHSLTSEGITTALNSTIPDFEDAVVAITASEVNARVIVTRNVKDFEKSAVPAMSAQEFMRKFYELPFE